MIFAFSSASEIMFVDVSFDAQHSSQDYIFKDKLSQHMRVSGTYRKM